MFQIPAVVIELYLKTNYWKIISLTYLWTSLDIKKHLKVIQCLHLYSIQHVTLANVSCSTSVWQVDHFWNTDSLIVLTVVLKKVVSNKKETTFFLKVYSFLQISTIENLFIWMFNNSLFHKGQQGYNNWTWPNVKEVL